MGKRLRAIGRRLGISSWQALIHLVVVEIIINVAWNWVSKTFAVDYVREIGFLVVFVAGLFAVAWYLPKLAPAYTGRTKVTTGAFHRPKLEHDGVLWEDGGYSVWGGLVVLGPLCPKDYTPLGVKYRDRIGAHINDDTGISDSGYHSQLICLECQTEYTLGTKYKTTKQSRDEVRSRFEGKRNRDQNS